MYEVDPGWSPEEQTKYRYGREDLVKTGYIPEPSKFHLFTTEVIYHFSCWSCHNWWSWGVERVKNHKTKMTCPHCGITALTVEKT